MATTRERAFLIYQYLSRANLENVNGSMLSQFIEQILGTCDYRQKKNIVRVMLFEKWLQVTSTHYTKFLETEYKVIPNGKLLSPEEKIEQLLERRKQLKEEDKP